MKILNAKVSIKDFEVWNGAYKAFHPSSSSERDLKLELQGFPSPAGVWAMEKYKFL